MNRYKKKPVHNFTIKNPIIFSFFTHIIVMYKKYNIPTVKQFKQNPIIRDLNPIKNCSVSIVFFKNILIKQSNPICTTVNLLLKCINFQTKTCYSCEMKINIIAEVYRSDFKNVFSFLLSLTGIIYILFIMVSSANVLC